MLLKDRTQHYVMYAWVYRSFTTFLYLTNTYFKKTTKKGKAKVKNYFTKHYAKLLSTALSGIHDFKRIYHTKKTE